MLIELVNDRGTTIDSCSVHVKEGDDEQQLLFYAIHSLDEGVLRNPGSVVRVTEYRG